MESNRSTLRALVVKYPNTTHPQTQHSIRSDNTLRRALKSETIMAVTERSHLRQFGHASRMGRDGMQMNQWKQDVAG